MECFILIPDLSEYLWFEKTEIIIILMQMKLPHSLSIATQSNKVAKETITIPWTCFAMHRNFWIHIVWGSNYVPNLFIFSIGAASSEPQSFGRKPTYSFVMRCIMSWAILAAHSLTWRLTINTPGIRQWPYTT